MQDQTITIGNERCDRYPVGNMVMRSDSDVVTLTMPAKSDFLQLIRLNAAGALANAGFSIDEIEDVKIGVEELSAVLLSRGNGARLELSIFVDANGAIITGERAAGPDQSTELEDFVGTILEAVVDSFEIETFEHGLRFTMRKRLRDQ